MKLDVCEDMSPKGNIQRYLQQTGFANTPNLAYFTPNCSNDSTEGTEGVTSTPEIFGNKHSFVLTFFATNTIYVNCQSCKP